MRSVNKRIIGVLVLVGIVGLGACGAPTAPKPSLHFQGSVTDAATGAPIAGASVDWAYNASVGGWTTLSSTLTDAAGRFAFDGPPGCSSGNFFVVIASGYDPQFPSAICLAVELPREFKLKKIVVP